DTGDKPRAHSADGPALRDPVADPLLREPVLTVSSDWALMASKASAAGAARARPPQHAHAVRETAAAVGAGRVDNARQLAGGWATADGLFPGRGARRLPEVDAPAAGAAPRAPRTEIAGTPGRDSEGQA